MVAFYPGLKSPFKLINLLLRDLSLEADVDEGNKVDKVLEIFCMLKAVLEHNRANK